MIDTKVATRYAKAFLDLNKEQNSVEAAYHDMSQLLTVCHQNKDFRLMLKNPLIQPDKKTNILKKVFEGSFSKLTMAYLLIIVKKRRADYLEEIALDFTAQYKVLKGITTATVVSAVSIDENIRKEIKRIIHGLSKSEVELEEKLDGNLIGGFILRYGDVQYDASVARNLNMYRMNFSKNLYQSKLWKK